MGYLSQKPPISRRQIKNLGKAFRDRLEFDKQLRNKFYEHQLLIMGELVKEIEGILGSGKLGVSPQDVTINSRVKTVHTTREKLQRMTGFSLDSLQDIVGVRLTVDLSLTKQLELAEQLSELLLHGEAIKVSMSDTRVDTHSGYRAIHLRVNFPAGRTEIQIRSLLQGKWANLYEAAGDTFGREIRYIHVNDTVDPSQLHPKIARYLELSELCMNIEQRWDIWEVENSEHSAGGNEIDSEFLKRMKQHALQLMQQEYDDITYGRYLGKEGE